ncbi:MAG: hypothetical protein ABR522_02345 [Marinobacter sp.]
MKELDCRGTAAKTALLGTLLLLLFAGKAHAESSGTDEKDANTRVITTPSTTSEVSVVIGKKFVRRLYESCDLNISYLDVPAARAVMMAEKSQSDGELARISMAVKENAPLLRLDVAIDDARLVPLFRNKESAESYVGLTGKRIGFLNGYRMIAAVLPEDTTQVATSDTFQLVSLLKRQRIDVALTLEWDALAAQQHNSEMVIGEPLLESPLYHWVHESRKADIPCLSNTLEEMRTDGEFQRMIREGIKSEWPE